MSPIQSKEEVASSIASGIASSSSSIISGNKVDLDQSSEYPGNSTAAEKIPKEAEYASSIAEVLNGFVSRIQSTAAEFVAVDSQLAADIDTNTSVLPQTSAVPKNNTTFVPNSSYFSEEE